MTAEMGTNLGSINPMEDETNRKAVMTVCHYATDADDAADLMAMLGLDAVKPACSKCGNPMSRTTNLGRVRPHGEDGVCNTCIKRAAEAVKRAERRARRAAQL